MRRLLQATLILVLLCCVASGCGEPGYGYYGHPGYGYAPYSYGWPVYTRGYSPVFIDHHPWEDHHYGGGHHQRRTITMAEGITRRLAVAIRAALAGADTWEASAVATAAAGIAECRC